MLKNQANYAQNYAFKIQNQDYVQELIVLLVYIYVS